MQDALQMILRTFLWDVPMEGYLGDPWGATAPTALVAWREGKVRQVMLCLEQHEPARPLSTASARPDHASAARCLHGPRTCPATAAGPAPPPAATCPGVQRHCRGAGHTPATPDRSTAWSGHTGRSTTPPYGHRCAVSRPLPRQRCWT